jgi:hypothetical protein
VGDDARELGRQGDKEGFLAGVKAPLQTLLHHQHPKHPTLVDDRHPKKSVVGLFPNFLKVTKARMVLGVIQV